VGGRVEAGAARAGWIVGGRVVGVRGGRGAVRGGRWWLGGGAGGVVGVVAGVGWRGVCVVAGGLVGGAWG